MKKNLTNPMKSLIFNLMKKQFEKSGYRINKPSMIQPTNDYWMRVLLYFKKIFDIIANIEGDIVECGVGKGNTFLFLTFLMNFCIFFNMMIRCHLSRF